MRVQFRTNLGSVDAQKFGVDFRKCTYKAVLECPDEIGEALCKFGAAFALPEKPVALKAVPKVEEIQAVESVSAPTVDPESKSKKK